MEKATMNLEHLKQWVGRTEERTDIATAAPLGGLAATLDHTDPPWAENQVPPLGHWLYFLPNEPQRDIGEDGHPKRGAFLPPVELPRRMWAGGNFAFFAPISVGDVMYRRSTIASVDHKSGRSGDMIFVKVVHEISANGNLAIRETHDIVYREALETPSAAPTAEAEEERIAEFSREIVPDPVLLFRFSALTFNAHRIHYDRNYCEKVEGYPGLVVHGPLTATLLMDLYLRQSPSAAVRAFRFRARRPLFDIHPFQLCGVRNSTGANLWALDHKHAIAMTAELEVS